MYVFVLLLLLALLTHWPLSLYKHTHDGGECISFSLLHANHFQCPFSEEVMQLLKNWYWKPVWVQVRLWREEGEGGEGRYEGRGRDGI